MGGMTQSLWAITNVWRQMGIAITDDEAENVRQLCVKKMEAARVADPEGYLPLLYADEVKWKLVFGKTINVLSASRMEENVCVKNVEAGRTCRVVPMRQNRCR